MDMVIERNNSALRVIEPIAEEIIALKEGEEKDGQPIGRMHYSLRPNTLGPIHIGAIARLYGDPGDEVVHHLSRNPLAVLPIVYNRMKEKHVEWRKVRTDWNKQWKIATAENFEGSLDVLCFFKKQELENKLKLENLREVSTAG
jgi:paired amphipathic helix protein Sin3a